MTPVQEKKILTELVERLDGKRESLRRAFLSRQSILLWSPTTFAKNHAKFSRRRADPAYAHLEWHHLRTPRAARDFLRAPPRP